MSRLRIRTLEKTIVIVKFTDKEAAKEFVRNVDTYDRKDENMIKRIGFTSESLKSLSSTLCYLLSLLVGFVFI